MKTNVWLFLLSVPEISHDLVLLQRRSCGEDKRARYKKPCFVKAKLWII